MSLILESIYVEEKRCLFTIEIIACHISSSLQLDDNPRAELIISFQFELIGIFRACITNGV